MFIQRDCSKRGRTKPRLSAADKAEIVAIIRRMRDILGTRADAGAHTIQIVFTSDDRESVITIAAGD